MKVGDRVRYRDTPVEGGYHSPAWVEWEGTLTHLPSGKTGTATVEFDGRGTHWPFLQNLELIEMPAAFKIGNRVRYTGNHPNQSDSAYLGALGTVVAPQPTPGNVQVRWDNPKAVGLVAVNGERGVYPENLELASTVDTAEPLQMRGTIGGDRDVTFVTLTSDDNILVTEVGKSGWIIFDQMGKFVRSEGGGGSALVLKNKIRTRSSYTVIDHMGAHWSGYFNRQTAWDRHPNANHMIQIDTRDGVVVGVGTLKRPA